MYSDGREEVRQAASDSVAKPEPAATRGKSTAQETEEATDQQFSKK